MPRAVEKGKKDSIVDMVLHGYPRVHVARVLRVSPSVVTSTMRAWATWGGVTTKRWRNQKGRKRILDPLDCSFLEACITRTPDILLDELREELGQCLGVWVHITTISRTLERRGWTRKKITRPAREATEEAQTRFEWLISQYLPEQLVFVDESHCNRFTAHRNYGWSLRGTRARRHDFFVRGQRYSVLPALSLDGVLHLDVQDHSYTGNEFQTFIASLLDSMMPYPARNSVIVCDNASIHKRPGLREMIEARGMRLLYLPPYSPQYNPIEEGFSSMKARIRRDRDNALGELSGLLGADPYTMLWNAVFDTMTPENAEGWFRHSGYF